ncbi:MAG: low molecular weight phosphotyrosine protein phosphatase [Bacteroidaceae bacterium]|nr:low molecular weight phosphotyrosine protein phosphatase [Bacteroidaceae bacterium]
MKKILFVCLGNICRSPMAEEVFRQYVINQGAKYDWYIDSAGIGSWHAGHLPDHRMRKAAEQHGYNLTMRARQVSSDDFNNFDYIVAMDRENIQDLRRIARSKQQADKILSMADYLSNHPGQETIPDPYYGVERDFHFVIELLEDAVSGLYKKVRD